MIIVSSAIIGETVTLTLHVYDKEQNKTDPDGWDDPTPVMPTVAIRKGDTRYVDNIVDWAPMTRDGLGEYIYKWDTAGMKPGPYTITARSVVDGDVRKPQKKDFFLECSEVS